MIILKHSETYKLSVLHDLANVRICTALLGDVRFFQAFYLFFHTGRTTADFVKHIGKFRRFDFSVKNVVA